MQLEIFFDILCPWCYIGKRRLDAALEGFTHRKETHVVWRSMELAPDEGREPGPTAAEAMTEWMDPAAVQARIALIQREGAAVGLTLDLTKARPVSTFDAHRLVHLADRGGRADALLEHLYRAYHVEGRNIAAPGTLTELADAAGLDHTEVGTVLKTDAYAGRVAGDRQRAAALGIRGVPSLSIDGRPAFSGVQPVAALRAELDGAHPPAAEGTPRAVVEG
ncbi:DsbA family oxidoreductase [Salinispora sp. H7-4]|uniref:DsbA family oxidoreductase n=1 Tax=Salinispora sp. H7-4 TaxID=2748321 RepID=UPI0015D3965A|nr:DsbA family oxidoreductase [Salinispora sp. H7-4]NYT95681.1 DsbA family oxidoreductase [Salinispora sp. H7-4]